MLVRLIEIERGIRGGTPRLKEVYINSQHIISVSDDFAANETLIKETKQLGLTENVVFSKVIIHEGNVPKSITVVGSPAEIYRKVKEKQILKG
jgi:hypothetical protein